MWLRLVLKRDKILLRSDLRGLLPAAIRGSYATGKVKSTEAYSRSMRHSSHLGERENQRKMDELWLDGWHDISFHLTGMIGIIGFLFLHSSR
jgi:hypothetical protein